MDELVLRPHLLPPRPPRRWELVLLRVSEREWERRRGAKRRPKPTVTHQERGLVRELRKAEQRMHELAEMLGAAEIDRRAYRVATTRTSQRIEEITRELDVAANRTPTRSS